MALGNLIAPFLAVVVALLLLPFRIAVSKWVPESKIKRLLLTRVSQRRR